MFAASRRKPFSRPWAAETAQVHDRQFARPLYRVVHRAPVLNLYYPGEDLVEHHVGVKAERIRCAQGLAGLDQNFVRRRIKRGWRCRRTRLSERDGGPTCDGKGTTHATLNNACRSFIV